MKVAIDVHSIGSGAGGNETYFCQLLKGLAGDPSDNLYTLFHTHPRAVEQVNGDRRFHCLPIPQNPIRRICISIPRLLRQIKPDVFHCQYVRPPFSKAKTVVTIHDLAHERFPEYFHPLEAVRLRRQVRATAQRADHILTDSRFSAADIADRYGIPPEKITVAYPAASEQFRPRDKLQAQEHIRERYGISSPFILYVGRIQARKNLGRLLEAYALLRGEGADCKLVLVGKRNRLAERLLARVRELSLSDSVILSGYVADDDLPLFYNAAELFVFPSMFEGFGLPVVESMASGVPTITSHGSSLEEVAGGAAILVDPHSVDSIHDAIEKVLTGSDLRSRLVSTGLRRSAEFQPGDLAAKVLEVYRSLV